jgi:hypothetical protein
MRLRFLQFIARLTAAAPILVLTGCALLTVAAGVAAFSLFPVETDLLALLPASSHESAVFRHAIQDFGNFDYLIVVVESERPNQEDRLIRLGRRFAEPLRNFESDWSTTDTFEIRRNEFVQSIEFAPAATSAPAPLSAAAESPVPALLTEWELARLDWVLHEEIGRRLELLNAKLTGRHAPAERERLLADPLALRPIFYRDENRFRGPLFGRRGDDIVQAEDGGIEVRLDPSGLPAGSVGMYRSDGLLISSDGRMLLMVIRPRYPATDLLRTDAMMRQLRTDARYALESGGADAAGCRIDFIGSHAEAENDAASIRRDLALTMVASFILVLVLFLLVVRRISAILFVGVPLGVALVWTLGLTAVFIDRLSFVTCAFGAALVGLGIDYSIHIYNRYIEEQQRRPRPAAEALEIALTRTGQGILLSALTAAVAFFGICFTRFEGLVELGLIGGIGVFCSLAATLFVLPPLILLSERLPARLGSHRPPSSLGLGRIATAVRSHPRLTVMIGLLLTAYLGYHAQHVRFEQDVNALRELPEHYDDLIRRTENRFELPASQIIAIVGGATLEEALRQNDQLYDRLMRAVPQGYPVLGFDSMRTILASIATQEQARNRLTGILDSPDLEARIRDEARRHNFDRPVIRTLLDQLDGWRRLTTESATLVFGGESSLALADRVRRYVYRDATHSLIATHIYLRPADWHRLQEDFIAFLTRGGNGQTEITGVPIVAHALRNILIHGMSWAVVLVSLAVFLLLIAHFRAVRKALLAMTPVLCSMVWTLGAMSLFGMPLNFLSALVIPLIVGLGIDDGIHILQRYYESARSNIEDAVEQTGRAVAFTSLTTILAFSTFFFASFRGIREIGIVAVMGIGFALIAALVFVPALLKLGGERLSLVDMVSSGKADEENSRTIW